MFLATVLVSSVLAAIVTMSAIGKLAKHPVIVQNLTKTGVPLHWFPRLAALELAGAVGVIIGLFALEGLGIAAAIGLALYFAGAVITHMRAKDPDYSRAGGIMIIAIASAVLRVIKL